MPSSCSFSVAGQAPCLFPWCCRNPCGTSNESDGETGRPDHNDECRRECKSTLETMPLGPSSEHHVAQVVVPKCCRGVGPGLIGILRDDLVQKLVEERICRENFNVHRADWIGSRQSLEAAHFTPPHTSIQGPIFGSWIVWGYRHVPSMLRVPSFLRFGATGPDGVGFVPQSKNTQDTGKLRRSEALPGSQHQQLTIFIRHPGKRDTCFQTVLLTRVDLDTQLSADSTRDPLKKL